MDGSGATPCCLGGCCGKRQSDGDHIVYVDTIIGSAALNKTIHGRSGGSGYGCRSADQIRQWNREHLSRSRRFASW